MEAIAHDANKATRAQAYLTPGLMSERTKASKHLSCAKIFSLAEV